jgi:hypothetical protein
MEGRSVMSRIFRHISKHLRPGLYLLDNPVRMPSSMNVWEEADVRAGGCDPEDVGTPVEYLLHAVSVQNPDEWYGHDEPPKSGAKDRQRAAAILRENAAIVFSPAELPPLELVRFLSGARFVRGARRARIGGAA